MGEFIGGVWYVCCGWMIIGVIAGSLARNLMGSKDYPLPLDLLLGVGGAIAGGIIVGILGFDDQLDIGFGIGSLITATVGAMVLIWIGHTFFGTGSGRKR
jgi:uncharacterized membrane protein YeaQ/YmgE (transglycosylase-associated protein family)